MSNQMLIKKMAERLIENDLSVAVAESCTGGMVAQQFTSFNGSSNWFECGFVTYSNASKVRLLEVQADVLDEYGAVSSQVAEQMAVGVLNHSDADVSASITGIAGPGGGSAGKPVGTVYIATATKSGFENSSVNANHYLFAGDRQAVREQAAHRSIVDLLNRLNE